MLGKAPATLRLNTDGHLALFSEPASVWSFFFGFRYLACRNIKKCKTKRYFGAERDFLSQPDLTDQTGKAFQRFISGECFFVHYSSNFAIFCQCFDSASNALFAWVNSGSAMILNGFLSSVLCKCRSRPALMLLRLVAL